MYREILEPMSTEELFENVERLRLAVEELEYCLENLLEEKDELITTNSMYKQTVEFLNTKKETVSGSLKAIWKKPPSQWKAEIKGILTKPQSARPALVTSASPKASLLQIKPLFQESEPNEVSSRFRFSPTIERGKQLGSNLVLNTKRLFSGFSKNK